MSMIGKTLGHYIVSTLIGRGGMGEVYQAKDQKLGRNVAIKVLPEEFAKDADRVARFQREAKLLASLNHPNIAGIYGLEESDGTHFLVLELIEGDTLAERLKRGAIPVEESLKLALQIAEALEAAHEKGVIHRDLKPANIKVTPDGKVKVLDFGLAKAFAGEQGEMILSDSPTLSVAATQKGVILGTACYMSPEQARGKSVDKRADIWAFGVVLFEMFRGKQLFTGETVSDTLAAVLTKEPDFSSLPPTLHTKIMDMLNRCLEKDSKNRYRDIGDARVDIQKVLADPSGILVQPAADVKSRASLRLTPPSIAVVIVLTAIIVGTVVWSLRTPAPSRVIRFDHDLPENQQIASQRDAVLAVSPDGTQFVYSTSRGLYLRSFDEMEARLIVGTEEFPRSPFFSPDGKWIGYMADNQLKKIAIDGGSQVTLCEVNNPFGFDWYEDKTIIYAEIPRGVMRVSANGGTPELIHMAGSGNIIFPQILPDGKSVLFTNLQAEPLKIAAQRFGSDERKELFEGVCAKYLSTGHIVYWLDNNLFAVPFDPDTLKTTGEHIRIVENVLKLIPQSNAAQYAISNSGTLVFMPGNASTDKRTLIWVDREGNEEPLKAPPDSYSNPAISPDGKRVAIRIGQGNNSDIHIWDIVHNNMMRLTFDPASDTHPLWSLDGQRVIFASNREGDRNSLYWRASDGSGVAKKLDAEPSPFDFWPVSWSKDGKTLILNYLNNNFFDIGTLSIDGDGTWESLLTSESHLVLPQISPDGRWMTYHAEESGQNEVFVRPFPDVNGGRWQVSNGGGAEPIWSPDGREIFYRNGNAVMTVSVNAEPTFSYGTPKILFHRAYVSDEAVNWRIAPDGKRFLMIKSAPTTDDESTGETGRKINIVLNWFEELKERVPTD